jgi:hypothetical protein
MTDTAAVRNTYSSSFILDKSKMTRLINIIIQKFNEHGFQPNLSFEVTLRSGKIVNISSLDELFSLDNAVHNSISVLKIKAEDSNNDSGRNFKAMIRYDDDKSENIIAQVQSSESGIALQLFSELEEQIERTLLKDWIYKLLKGDIFSKFFSLITISVAVIASLIIFTLPSLNGGGSSTELIKKYSTATTQEEKINFLFDNAMRELKSNDPSNMMNEFNINKFFTLQTLFLVLPILVVIGTIIYIATNCFPHANFLWGDYEEHYAKIINRRNTLWYVVVASIIVAILGNLFVMGMAGSLHLGQ